MTSIGNILLKYHASILTCLLRTSPNNFEILLSVYVVLDAVLYCVLATAFAQFGHDLVIIAACQFTSKFVCLQPQHIHPI